MIITWTNIFLSSTNTHFNLYKTIFCSLERNHVFFVDKIVKLTNMEDEKRIYLDVERFRVSFNCRQRKSAAYRDC